MLSGSVRKGQEFLDESGACLGCVMVCADATCFNFGLNGRCTELRVISELGRATR